MKYTSNTSMVFELCLQLPDHVFFLEGNGLGKICVLIKVYFQPDHFFFPEANGLNCLFLSRAQP